MSLLATAAARPRYHRCPVSLSLRSLSPWLFISNLYMHAYGHATHGHSHPHRLHHRPCNFVRRLAFTLPAQNRLTHPSYSHLTAPQFGCRKQWANVISHATPHSAHQRPHRHTTSLRSDLTGGSLRCYNGQQGCTGSRTPHCYGRGSAIPSPLHVLSEVLLQVQA